ncbi:MAG TPA: peptide ABC transporter substrate-binding protein [Ktedonobacterales bacterium]|nr:peptide ABC transporter substrate-binding protein [Ktedonobacterales bacterium]
MLRQRNLWYLLAVGLLLMVTALSACGPTASTTNTGPKQGGSIIDGVQEETNSLMPAQSTETFADLVDAAIWASLVYTNDQFQLSPGLLTEVPSTTNGGIVVSGSTETYNLHLRPNLKWSDGQPLTSADVAFTIKTFSDPGYGDKQGFPAEDIASVDTPDASTVVIHLNKINVAFLTLALTDPLIFTPLPQHIYQNTAPADIAKVFTPTVTSGPFTVTDADHVKGDHITVKRNKNYFQAGKPYLDQVTFKFFPDAETQVKALQAGQIDTAYFLPVTDVETLKNIPGYNLFTPKSSPNYEAWYFNMSNPTLADPKVRQALAMSFDVKQEITTIQKGNAVPTCDDATGTFAHEANLVSADGYCPYGPNASAKVDPAAAKALLESDGYTMGSDGYYTKGGKTLELRISTTAGRQYRLDSEQLAQAAWKNIGVKIDVNNFPSSTFFGPILFPSDHKYDKANDQWDIAEFENSIGVDPDNHLIWTSTQVPSQGGQNLTYYNNPQVDQWEAQQLQAVDQTQRKQLFHQIHEQILKDIPTFYLYSPLDLSEYKATLHNYKPDSIGPSETWNIWDWYLS